MIEKAELLKVLRALPQVGNPNEETVLLWAALYEEVFEKPLVKVGLNSKDLDQALSGLVKSGHLLKMGTSYIITSGGHVRVRKFYALFL